MRQGTSTTNLIIIIIITITNSDYYRITLDKCWGDDCKWVSREASYNFRACPGVDIKANPVRPVYHDKAAEHVGFIHRSKEYCRKRSERNKLAFDRVKSEYELPAEKVVFFCISKTVRFDFMTLVRSTLGITLTTNINNNNNNNNNNNIPTLIIINI
jgi:hypothetical protein